MSYGEPTSENLQLVAGESLVRDRVDPGRTLPEVVLHVYEKEDLPDDFCREKVNILHEGLPVGWCDLVTRYRHGAMNFDMITLDETERTGRNFDQVPRKDRVKGLGLASYLVAIETAHARGLPFESQEGDLSLGSHRIWEILAERGAATVVEPPSRYMQGAREKVLAKYSADVLKPTQEQLRALRDTIFEHEPKVAPFDGLLSEAVLEEFDTDLSDFEILAGPPTYNESMAPASTLRTPDQRVIWLSVFRNPDTNKVTKQHLMIIDPPVNRKVRPEIPREDYEITETESDGIVIECFDGPDMTADGVAALHHLVKSSKPFNAFLELDD